MQKQSIVPSDQIFFSLEDGIKKIRLLLEQTYGPFGKNLLLDSKKRANPELLRNGSKILRQLRTSNDAENFIFLLLEDSFQKITSTSGDGTKTFFLITSYLILNTLSCLSQNSYAVEIKTGMAKTIDYALTILQDRSLPVRKREFLNTVIDRYIPSDDNLQLIFKKVFDQVGKSGELKLKTETGKKTKFFLERGMQINKGFFSPYFVNDTQNMVVHFENPYLLLSLQKIEINDGYLFKLLERIISEKRSIFILSQDIDEQGLESLILNKLNGILDVAYVKLPHSDNTIFEDLAFYTKAKVIQTVRDWKTIQLSDLGQAEKILITKTKTMVWANLRNQEELLQNRCQELKQQMIMSNSDYENEKRESRRKNLSGVTAIIRLGGLTDLETTDRCSRTEQGLLGAKACLYEGILPGGGLCFLHLNEEIENWKRSNFYGNALAGSNLVLSSFLQPLQLLTNQQFNRKSLIPKSLTKIEKKRKMLDVSRSSRGKDQKSLRVFESGIMDSFKSLRMGLQTSLSLTSSIFSIAYLILRTKP